jgi:hypothetical protein
MSQKNNRIVFKRGDEWVNRKLDADRASSVHTTQQSAEIAARQMLKTSGGGELITKGLDGKIRSKDTIGPAADPCPPRDREH